MPPLSSSKREAVAALKRGEAVIAGQRTGTAEQAGYPKQCVTALPVVDHDPVAGTREDLLGFDPWRYVKPGKPVLAESLGAVQRAAELGAVVEAGPHLPLVNRLSLETMADWGVERVWLSPELTLGQVADLAENAPVALGLLARHLQHLDGCQRHVLEHGLVRVEVVALEHHGHVAGERA